MQCNLALTKAQYFFSCSFIAKLTWFQWHCTISHLQFLQLWTFWSILIYRDDHLHPVRSFMLQWSYKMCVNSWPLHGSLLSLPGTVFGKNITLSRKGAHCSAGLGKHFPFWYSMNYSCSIIWQKGKWYMQFIDISHYLHLKVTKSQNHYRWKRCLEIIGSHQNLANNCNL